MSQTLFTRDILRRLRANGQANLDKGHIDLVPVVKIYNPFGQATWLLTESDPEDPDRLFGLRDLGTGHPELSYISKMEFEDHIIRINGAHLSLERDKFFEPTHTLAVYTRAARRANRIVEEPAALDAAQALICAERARAKAVPDDGWIDWPPHLDQGVSCGND